MKSMRCRFSSRHHSITCSWLRNTPYEVVDHFFVRKGEVEVLLSLHFIDHHADQTLDCLVGRLFYQLGLTPEILHDFEKDLSSEIPVFLSELGLGFFLSHVALELRLIIGFGDRVAEVEVALEIALDLEQHHFLAVHAVFLLDFHSVLVEAMHVGHEV